MQNCSTMSAWYFANSLGAKITYSADSCLIWTNLPLITGGMVNLNALSDSDREAVEGPIRQRYIAEFSANSIRNLEVVERLDAGSGIPVKTSD